MSIANRSLLMKVRRPFLRWLVLVFLHLGFTTVASEALPPLVCDLPVTNGLIRWWPNLFDVRDEISGQEGVVMGILPPVRKDAEDDTPFRWDTGFVQLAPAVTNETFSFSLWIRPLPGSLQATYIGQESNEGEWFFGHPGVGLEEYFVSSYLFSDAERTESVRVKTYQWQHIVIARKSDGRSIFWVDGVRVLEGRQPHLWPSQARWLTAGNQLKGDDYEHHYQMRDLTVFDRLLADEEVKALHAAGLPNRPARNTSARLAATGRITEPARSTNVVTIPEQAMMHRRFTTGSGLPGNNVKAVMQARSGYLWVGTEDGLARFDGKEFRSFTAANTPALKEIGQTVWSLAEDVDGTIWAGIFGGLLRIRGQEFRAFTNGLPQKFVLQAEPAGDGSVWVAAFNNFVPRGPLWLRRYHPEEGRTSAEMAVPGHVRRLAVTEKGLWMSAEQPWQVYFWDTHSPALTAVAAVGERGLPPRQIEGELTRQARFQSWQEDRGAWAELKPGSGAPAFYWFWDEQLPSGIPRAARQAGTEGAETWLGAGRALVRIAGDRLERLPTDTEGQSVEIASVCANREGGAWFGREEGGLHFVQERPVRVFGRADGVDCSESRTIVAGPDGSVWVAGFNGLIQWKDRRWTEHGSAKLRAVAVDAEGRPWFGRQGGGELHIGRDQASPSVFYTSLAFGLQWHDPNTLRFTRDGTLWVVDERGLTWVKPEGLVLGTNHLWIPDPKWKEPVFARYAMDEAFPGTVPIGLVEDRDGALWLGSLANGLFRLKDGRIQSFSEKDGLAGKRCIPVYRDRLGALWLVTDKGLARRAEGKFQSITTDDGLPDDVFQDLIEDDFGTLWISGKRGIHGVLRREAEDFFSGQIRRVRSLTLGERDGLENPECSSLHQPTMAKTSDGFIWVATRMGVASFDPRRVRLNTQPLRSIIEQLVVNRKDVLLPAETPSSPKTIRLSPGSGERLELRFTAISLLAADAVRFRYRLEGYDSDWSEPSDLRLAFYTNLRPGAYTFRVKACNAHGIWNEQDTSLAFVILPFFWQTQLFYGALAAAVLASLLLIHLRRLSIQRQDQEFRLQKTLLDEKTRIASDMHDQLGATLTQIAILGEIAKTQKDPVQSRSTLERISQSARDVTAGMSELVWATDPRNDTLENVVAYLREQAASQLQDSPIRPVFDFPGEVPGMRVSATFRRNLLLVVREGLHNAIKHSNATEVRVSLSVASSGLNLLIEDNGRGFEKAEHNSERTIGGNGLRNMEARISELGGRLVCHSQPGKGTKIRISLAKTPS